MALIVFIQDSDVYICHSQYFETHSSKMNIMEILTDIGKRKYQNLFLKEFKPSLAKEAYEHIMNLYKQQNVLTMVFNTYGGRIGVDFVWIPRNDCNTLLSKYT